MGDGRAHRLSLELYDPEGHRFLGPIVTGPEGIAPPAPAVITIALVFTSQNLVFGQPGRYSILLRADDSDEGDRKSTRLNSSHGYISYAVFCLKKKKKKTNLNMSAVEIVLNRVLLLQSTDE